LSVSGEVGSILLEWGASSDEPDCSGIDYYNVSRDGVWIGTVEVEGLSFVDNEILGVGFYNYTVFAVDMIGHNVGDAVVNEVALVKSDGRVRVSGGGSSSSYVCVEDWACDEWSECVGNDMRRICNDLNECGTVRTKPETYQNCGSTSLDSLDSGMSFEEEVDDADVSPVVRAFSAITGAVVGGGAASVAAAGVFLFLVLGGFFIVIRKKKK